MENTGMLSVEQLAQMKKIATTLRLMNSIRSPQAMIDLVLPKGSPVRSLIRGDDYNAITKSILEQYGFDPEKVREQLQAEGIV